MNRTYICIDLKSFYASVECVLRGLDPLTTNLVVADTARTEKTICLAVSPSLKKYGIPGRARLFEVIQAVNKINSDRKKKNHYKKFIAKSYKEEELKDYNYELDYIAACPQMKKYIEFSTKIYSIYLKYIAPEDIHVYSIDEAFMDVTNYLNTYKMSAEDLVRKMIKEVYNETGITATGGIGTNLYLAKIAMDIVAKHVDADEYGVRIASLNERTYKEKLWSHQPLSDFWRIGHGYETRLHRLGIYTMGDVARCALDHEDILYNEFGVNAEILIDHAFGIEPVTISDIKNYRPQATSLSVGQVIHCAYDYKKALVVVKEMATELSYNMIEKGVVTNQISISIGYDIESLKNYNGQTEVDHYGRLVPKGNHSSINLKDYTNITSEIVEASVKLFNLLCNRSILVRRMYVVATNTKYKKDIENRTHMYQMNIFSDFDNFDKNLEEKKIKKEKEEKLLQTVLNLKKRYGKNAVLKGTDLEDGATTIDRNKQIGGHKA